MRSVKICSYFILFGLVSTACQRSGSSASQAKKNGLDRETIVNAALETLETGTQDAKFLAAVGQSAKLTSKSLSLDENREYNPDLIKNLVKRVGRNLKTDFCRFVSPAMKNDGGQFSRPYFAAGVFSNSGLIGVQEIFGADWVWDLYNLQFANFVNKGFVSSIGAASMGSVGGNVYFAGAFGKKDDVLQAWGGAFQSVGFDASLPLISQYFSLSGGYFQGAKKMSANPKDGDPSMLGVTVGASLSISPPSMLSSLPGNIVLGTSEASPLDALTQKTFQAFKAAGIPVSMSGKETCGGHCIRFDSGVSKGANYSQRAAQLARSFLTTEPFVGALNNPAATDVLATMTSIAIAVGSNRDSPDSSQKCK